MKARRGAPGRSAASQARTREAQEAVQTARRDSEIEQASRPTPSARSAGVMYVWDTTAAPGASRVHEVIVKKDKRGQILTRSYTLSNDKPCEMPAAHALQFLRDEAFVVSTSEVPEEREEHRIRPVKARTENVNIIALTENETIAEWGELSDDALVRRAHAFPAADKPGENASRAELIVFLTEASRVKKADGDRLSDDGDLEGMGGDELDGLFGGDRRKSLEHELIPGGTRVRPAARKPS